MKRIRLLIADDHQVVVEGLRELLEPEFELTGTASDGKVLIARAQALKPDLIILDISMPTMNGIEAARRLRQVAPKVKLIFLTMYAEPIYVNEALRAGASGYVLKSCPVAELCHAVRVVAQGKTYVTPRVASEEETGPAFRQSGTSDPRLSFRQREVLKMVASGKSNKEIAAALDVSVKTVEFHKAAIMTKLGLRTTAELTRYAVKIGIVEL